MKTLIQISVVDGPAHTMKLGRLLSPEEQRRVLQAACAFVRTLQLWLEEEGREKLDISPDAPTSA